MEAASAQRAGSGGKGGAPDVNSLTEMDVTDTLNRAIAAAKAGRKAEARRLLEMVLDADERNERAWLWLSDVVESDEERIVCLENVLAINPDNEMARKGLAALRAAPAVDRSPSSHATQEGVRWASPIAETLRPSALEPASDAESPAGDSPSGALPVADNRLFIVITIVLALILICTVLSVLAFVMLSPLG
jgi:hypothetical protein